MVIKVLLLSNDRMLIELVKTTLKNNGPIQINLITLTHITFEKQLRSSKLDYDAIINHDFSVEKLKKQLDIPIIQLEYTDLSILKVLEMVKSDFHRSIICGEVNFTNRVKAICDLFEYDIPILTIKHPIELVDKIQEFKRQGRDLYICDSMTYVIGKLQTQYVFKIAITKEEIKKSIDQLIATFTPLYQEQKKSLLLSKIIKQSKFRYVLVNQNKELILHSVGDDEIERIQKSIDTADSTVRDDNSNQIYQMEKKMILIDDEIFFLYHLLENSEKSNFNHPAIKEVSNADLEQNLNQEYLRNFIVSKSVKNEIEMALNVSQTLLIEGAMGCRQFLIGDYAAIISNHKKMLSIDLKGVDDRFWIELKKIVLSNQQLVLIHHLDQLKRDQLKNLFYWCYRQQNDHSIQFIFTTQQTFGIGPLLNRYTQPFYISANTLASHQDRLSVICQLMINHIQYTINNKVTHLADESLLFISDLVWRENFDQLERILRWIIVQNKTASITKQQILEALKHERMLPTIYELTTNMNQIEPTLDDYMRQIIEIELKRHAGNKTKVRESLGIGRSKFNKIMNDES